MSEVLKDYFSFLLPFKLTHNSVSLLLYLFINEKSIFFINVCFAVVSEAKTNGRKNPPLQVRYKFTAYQTSHFARAPAIACEVGQVQALGSFSEKVSRPPAKTS